MTLDPPKGEKENVLGLSFLPVDEFWEGSPELFHLIRGNRDAALRLSPQLSELIAQGHIPFDIACSPWDSR